MVQCTLNVTILFYWLYNFLCIAAEPAILSSIELIKGTLNVKVNYTQYGNFERNELCLKNNGFNKGCVILTKPSINLNLSQFINYGQIFGFQITTFWCDGSKSITSPQNIENKIGIYFKIDQIPIN